MLIALEPDTNTHMTPELTSLATKAACLQQRHRLCAHWGQEYVGTKGDTPVPAVTDGSCRVKGPMAPHAPLKPTGSRNPLACNPPPTQDQASPRPCPAFWSPGEVRPPRRTWSTGRRGSKGSPGKSHAGRDTTRDRG